MLLWNNHILIGKKEKKEILLQVPVLEATEQRLCLEFQFESSSVMFASSDCSV